MSGNPNISNLSYKELQALALRYRVPGNIKKQLLIEVLEAARSGNEKEVDKLLSELRQNRKKRMRKSKPTKLTMSLASTPIHSPVYDMADDYYAAQHRLPYQWVGAEEEIPNRQLDDANRVPPYEEFRQFLLRRIQRDYQTYNTNQPNNGKVEPIDPGRIIDLRNDQGQSVRFETDTGVGIRPTNIVPVNSLESVQSYSEQIAQNPAAFDYHILEDPNGNGHASILLRRMLQAPVGADLGEIASPELGSGCRMWGNDNYHNDNNLLDNSDTLSANSDIDCNNDNEDNNWPIGTEYYRFVNNVREQLIFNSGNLTNRPNFDQSTSTGQFCQVLTDENPLQYQLLYNNQVPPNVQQRQQQWETPGGSYDNDISNYQKTRNQGSKIFQIGTNANYYDGINAANYATARISDMDHLQQQFINEGGSGYSGSQNVYENNNNNNNGSVSGTYNRPEMKFYENLNNRNNNERENSTAGVYSTSMESNSAREMINDPNDYTMVKPQIQQINYYHPSSVAENLHQTSDFISPIQHISFSNSQQQVPPPPPPPPAHNEYVENLQGCTSSTVLDTSQTQQSAEEFHRPSFFGPYHLIHKNDESDEIYENEIKKNEKKGGETENEIKTILGNASTTRSDSTMSVDAFWPEKSTGKNTTNNCLENILNLNNYGYVDYTKIDQTSCIYCYSAPIVTQKLYTGNSPCSQKNRFTAEFRQHTFSPYWLSYSDANTGMQLSNNDNQIDNEANQLTLVEERIDDTIENRPVVINEITNIALDLVNPENNVSEFRLVEQNLSPDQCYIKEISSLDSTIQLNDSVIIRSNMDSNDNNKIIEPSTNLNIENL